MGRRQLQSVRKNVRFKHKIFILLGMIILALSLARADNAKSSEEEEWLRARKQAQDLFAICGINGEKIWAVGKLGTILHSADGGKTWALQASGVEASLFDVIFADEKVGCIVGQKGVILETKDGGEKWEVKQKDKQYHLFSASFSGDYLYAVGDFGTVLRKKISTGTEWEEISLGEEIEDVILNKIQFLDDKIGWICGEFGLLLKTDSGGVTWDTIESLPAVNGEKPFVFTVGFRNQNQGVVTLPGNKVLVTEDGAQTWKTFVRKRSYYGCTYFEGRWYFSGEGGVEILNVDSDTWEYPAFFEKSGEVGLWLRDGYMESGKGWFVGRGGSVFLLSESGWQKIHP